MAWRLGALACVLLLAVWFWRPLWSSNATLASLLQRARAFIGETRAPSVTVTLPEGLNLFEVAERLEVAGICTATAFVRAALAAKLTVHGSTIEGAEGFLFPDTYQWRQGTPPARIVATMVANFERRTAALASELQAALPDAPAHLMGVVPAQIDAPEPGTARAARPGGRPRTLTTATASAKLISLPQGLLWKWITFASIVAKEAGAGELERVAGVFANRLARLDFEPRRLQADATRVYAQRLREHRTVLALAGSHKLASPDAFDTYRHAGLPPAPIGNPGLDALEASLRPESHAYLYFVRHPKHLTHVFSENFVDHQRNVAAWRASQSAGR